MSTLQKVSTEQPAADQSEQAKQPKENIQTVYKVLHQAADGKLYSFIRCLTKDRKVIKESVRGNYILGYKEGETIYPKIENSYLYCFSKLENAVSFKKIHKSICCFIPDKRLEVWKGKADVEADVFVKGNITSLSAISVFWKNVKESLQKERFWHDFYFHKPPLGTVLCKWVKLTEQVTDEEPY